MSIMKKELNEIGESLDTLNHLNELIKIWAKKHNWYIFINRVPKKGWVVYGLHENREQIQWCGLGIIEKYFDSPINSLKEFINVKF